MASNMANMAGKRSFKRWDDIEERMLAEAVKNYGVKGWERVAQEMKTDRTSKQLYDHWCERSKECLELLEKLGPAPRGYPTGIARREAELRKVQQKKTSKPSSDGLTRIPSLRYRYHPFQRDDRLRQVCEKADLERKREAIGRYLTHVNLLEEVLSPARPDGMGEQDAMKDDGEHLVQTKMEGGKMIVYDNQTLQAQNAVTSGLLDILKLAESMGTLDEEPKGIKKEELKTTGDEAAKSVGWEGEAGTFDDCDVMMLAEESSNKLFAPGEMRRLNQEEVGNEFLNPASVISRYDWKVIGL